MLLNLDTGEHISIVRSDTLDLETVGVLIIARKNVFDYYSLMVVLSTLQDGVSPLIVASYHSHLEITRLLINRGANLNSQNKVSITVDKVATCMD